MKTQELEHDEVRSIVRERLRIRAELSWLDNGNRAGRSLKRSATKEWSWLAG